MKRFLWGAVLAGAVFGACAEEWNGKVVGISDGDTLTIMKDSGGTKVRLVEIDAPESRQDYGAKSKQSLSDLCFGKVAKVDDQGADKYGRRLGRVHCAGVDANLEQITRGLAWFYVEYGHDPAMRDAEEQARASRIGLWADTNPTPPWDFRHGTPKKAARSTDEADGSASDCGGKSTCKQMTSCAEARHYLNDCGVSRLDRDRDGIPCESICR
ncbi:thermonuclease family protein [Methylococcus capsulatus]|uniref:thermonuclease family protein n=1 Tax=Methylococcus capsulatus TaxID=414 RepID=UPI001C52B283|nr:thermonuclease family protein [Methylococcus capsulatus]QXP95194.1 thermonuclease family protein [Methylococcus capsulatus]